MKQFRIVIFAMLIFAALGTLLRHKYKAVSMLGDTAWITVVIAGLSGQLRVASEWLNANVGTWSFVLGILGLGVSIYTKRRMLRAAEEGRLRIDEASGD